MDDGEKLQDGWSRWSGRIWSSNVINTRERGRGEKARMAERIARYREISIAQLPACLPIFDAVRIGRHQPLIYIYSCSQLIIRS